jgi:hypothetical protein
MTKREFAKLRKGDILLVIRHLLDNSGKIVVPENSEWKVEDIEVRPIKGQIDKSEKMIHIIDDHRHQSLTISKDNSVNFLVYKRKRGPLPRH